VDADLSRGQREQSSVKRPYLMLLPTREAATRGNPMHRDMVPTGLLLIFVDAHGTHEATGQKGLPLALEGNGAYVDPVFGRAAIERGQ
jgi:hypothetical protein